MTKKTVMTPAIQKQLEKWIEWLKAANGVRFHPTTDIAFKAKVVVETGHCPCKIDRKCPCPQVLDELKKDGMCFCHVFCTKKWAQEHGYLQQEAAGGAPATSQPGG